MSCLIGNYRNHPWKRGALAWVWLAALCLGVVGIGALVSSPATAAQEEENVAFHWAFGALVGNDTERKLEPITGDRVLRSGDRLKMMVELRKPCYVYVIYYGPQDQVKMLFPYSLSQLTTDYQPAKRYYLPQGGAWFELDQNTGSEVFHVLASPERLKGLEAVLSLYDAAEADRKPTTAKQVLAEIRELKKRNRQLATAAERPISIGGNVRGMDRPAGADGPDVAAIAQDISAAGFYSRTITIEHR
jgi:hypothetical protein